MPQRLTFLKFLPQIWSNNNDEKRISEAIMKQRNRSVRTQTNDRAKTKAQQGLQFPTTEQIQKRAHEIFIARGGEPGRELDDWLQAEHELKTVGQLPENNSAEPENPFSSQR